jgi:hypothetical protein
MSETSEGKLERNLALYTLATAATLAGVHQAQAEVVFTPSSAQFTGSPINIDMDNDGTVDFVLQTGGSCGSTAQCYIAWGVTEAPGVSGNGVAIDFPSQFQAALVRGNHIGRPNDHFVGRFMAESSMYTGFLGPWDNVTDRYLGVKFMINGEAHYGWIGFARTLGNPGFKAKFSGWAYETQPNTPIRAGQRTGTSDSPMAMDSENATSLELRAAGYVGRTALRNRARN